MFPKFSWSDDYGEQKSSICSVGAGGEVVVDVEGVAIVGRIEVDGGVMSGVELL